jgi:heparanase 1
MQSGTRPFESLRFENDNESACPKQSVVALTATLATLLTGGVSIAAPQPTVSVAPTSMPAIATIDDRFESYNVEMAEVIGGKFWKPYDAATLAPLQASAAAAQASKSASLVIGQGPNMFQARPPIDLSNPRLRRLAKALGPAYVRVSGTWANSVFFSDADGRLLPRRRRGFKPC